ncbi:MAG: glutaminyl-peptide cyclotransferase [Opitutus sp.]|nr:glutaminyl-peptide cyclotransferase [Opitutus sp.]
MAALLALSACSRPAPGQGPSVPPSPANARTVSRYSYEIVKVWPHDRTSFTQGLVFRNGNLLESTGLHGQSTLREVELSTGRSLKQVSLPAEIFAEGLAVIGSQAFQLTWQNGRALVYDADTLRRENEFTYAGEGWGLTTDGRWLILSDGSAQIRFIDPTTFAVVRSIQVTAEGQSVNRLNELEYIQGEIFANVWQTDEVVRIDPATGVVRGVIDFSGLLPKMDRRPDTDVLNGLAYDAATDRLFVTGKRWPNLFEVRLKVSP